MFDEGGAWNGCCFCGARAKARSGWSGMAGRAGDAVGAFMTVARAEEQAAPARLLLPVFMHASLQRTAVGTPAPTYDRSQAGPAERALRPTHMLLLWFPALQSRTVKRPGPNNGREFWSCGRFTMTGTCVMGCLLWLAWLSLGRVPARLQACMLNTRRLTRMLDDAVGVIPPAQSQMCTLW